MEASNTIYVVFKTHFDIGFTELAADLIGRWGRRMLPDVVNVCESTQKYGKDHHYVWTMPAWPLKTSLNSGEASAETVERAKELIGKGQIAWHVLPFTTHTEFCGLEEYIRGMYVSKALSEEYGVWPISAKMTDVVGHTWILPSLLAKAGVKFLHLGPNEACKLPEVPQLFFWEGPDGGRVLTFYNKSGGYGSQLLPPGDWPFPAWLALMQTSDNIGPQGPEIIEDIIAKVEKAAPGTKVVMGTMDDFYRALSACSLDEIPVVRGDLADTWIHGTGTYPGEVARLRTLRHTLTDTEKALSLAMLTGAVDIGQASSLKRHIDQAYESSILFGEHTWGLTTFKDAFMGYERYYQKEDLRKNGDIALYERAWDEQRQYVHDAAEALSKADPAVMNGIAAAVKADGPRFAIFNGLGWKRHGWSEIDAYKDRLSGKMLEDASTGEQAELTELDGKLHVFVKDLPALGYKTLIVKDGAGTPAKKSRIICDPEHGVLENWWYRITVDPAQGTITSLKDKSTGHEWVGTYGHHGFGQYQYDIYSEAEATGFLVDSSSRFHDWQVTQLVRKNYIDQEHVHFSPGGFTLDGQTGDHCGTLIMRTAITGDTVTDYGNGKQLTTKITLYEDQPYIDVQYELKGKEKTFCVEAGHFVFPIRLQNAQIQINKLGSVINPAVDIVEGTNHHLYCCEHWVDISDGEKGMAIVPYDTQLFSIGSHGILEYRRTYVKEEPILFFNAFNNSYGCNFPLWMEGDYSFRFRLIPHDGDWKQGDVARRAFESVAPPLAGYTAGVETGGDLPASLELMDELDGMEIVSFKPAEQGAGFILRLREINGEKRRVTVSFHRDFESVTSCDLLERMQGEEAGRTRRLEFHTEPFEIHTFLLKSGDLFCW